MYSYKGAIALFVFILGVTPAQSYTFKRSDATYAAPNIAETTFTPSGVGAVARTGADKLNDAWVSVTDFGADPTGVADSTSAFAAAYDRVVAMGGGTLYVPQGTYLATILPTIAQNGVVLQCAGNGAEGGGVRLAQTSTSGDFLTISGQHDWVRNCEFEPTVRITSGYQITFNNSFMSGAEYLRVQRGYNGIHVYGSVETHLTEISLRSLLGIDGLRYDGAVAQQSYGLTATKLLMDNPYPGTGYGPVKAWATGTSYSINDIVRVNNNIYQCSTAGTSAGSGSGPSGLPSGTTPASAFTGTITDGGVRWKFVAATLNWIVQDNYSTSLRMNNVNSINGYNGWLEQDTAATGTSHPKFNIINNYEGDHNYNNAARLSAGYDNEIVNSWFGSSLSTHGIELTSAYKGAMLLTTSRITANYAAGIAVGGGTGNIIFGNEISSNSISGSGASNGIEIAADVSKFIISANTLGADVDIGINLQDYGVKVATGSSDYYDIVNNICAAENVSGCVSDGGTGINKTITGNH
jgi:hypothetical protein